MPIFHASLRPLSRSDGHSAVAAAAYRAGSCLTDERTGLVHDYSRKAGVLDARMVVPDGASTWASDIAEVWNRAELAETRVNARVARELIIALPHELPESARSELAHRIAADLVDRYGCAVQVALHAPDAGGDARNFHAHLLLTTRKLGSDGFGAKLRILDDLKTGPQEIASIRQMVEALTNNALTAAGLATRVDCRTLDAQAEAAASRGDTEAVIRLARLPTTHEGRAATAAKRRGVTSGRAHRNHAVQQDNRALGHLAHARLRALNQLSRPAPPPRIAATSATASAPAVTAARRERENARRQIEALERAAADSEAQIAELLAALNASATEAERLRRFLAVASAESRVRAVLEAHAAWDDLRQRHHAAREAYAQAQVTTTRAQRALDKTEVAAPPPWKLSRRQWAQKRRAERAAVADAHAEEHKASALRIGVDRLEAAEAERASARDALWTAVDASEQAKPPAKPAPRLETPRPLAPVRKPRFRA